MISDFRKNHREEFEQVFVEILLLCRASGLTDLGEVSLDGQRVQGDASLSRNRTRKQIPDDSKSVR